MTKPRPTISLFTKTPKAVDPANADLRRPNQIPIRVVSRRAIEQLVESFNCSATHAD